MNEAEKAVLSAKFSLKPLTPGDYARLSAASLPRFLETPSNAANLVWGSALFSLAASASSLGWC